MAQTVIKSPTDVVDFLVSQHEQIKSLFAEKDEFAKLGEELSGDELTRMGRAAELAEAIAPTRPHAGVESQVANLTAGPFAAMMDRARDAIVGKG
jgi:hypothetical protein